MHNKEDAIEQKRSMIPAVFRINYDKAIAGTSRKAAIKAFCLECVCWQRQEVIMCSSSVCPLYPYRPYKAPNPLDKGVVSEAERSKTTEGTTGTGNS